MQWDLDFRFSRFVQFQFVCQVIRYFVRFMLNTGRGESILYTKRMFLSLKVHEMVCLCRDLVVGANCEWVTQDALAKYSSQFHFSIFRVKQNQKSFVNRSVPTHSIIDCVDAIISNRVSCVWNSFSIAIRFPANRCCVESHSVSASAQQMLKPSCVFQPMCAYYMHHIHSNIYIAVVTCE